MPSKHDAKQPMLPWLAGVEQIDVPLTREKMEHRLRRAHQGSPQYDWREKRAGAEREDQLDELMQDRG